jgi:hypothetical protein
MMPAALASRRLITRLELHRCKSDGMFTLQFVFAAHSVSHTPNGKKGRRHRALSGRKTCDAFGMSR